MNIIDNPNFEKAIILYQSGMIQRDIANQLEISKGTVSKYIKLAIEIGKLKERQKKKKIPVQETPKFKKFVQLYNEGKKSQKQIAIEIGVSKWTLQKYKNLALELGLIKKKIRQEKKEFLETIELYTKTKLTLKEIAEIVGISYSTVSKYIKTALELNLIEKRKPEPKKENPKVEQAKKLYYEEHLTQVETAKRLNMSQSCVSKYIRYEQDPKKSISELSRRIQQYIKNREYEEAIEFLDELGVYLQGMGDDEEIIKARKMLKEAINEDKVEVEER